MEVHHRSTSGPHLSGPDVDPSWVPNKPVPIPTGNKLACDLIRSKVFSAHMVQGDFVLSNKIAQLGGVGVSELS